MGLLDALSGARWMRMFRSEARVRAGVLGEGRAPDATVDEVGATNPNIGFEGDELGSTLERGNGTGNPSSGEWAGWG
jgi:hypothetical protein